GPLRGQGRASCAQVHSSHELSDPDWQRSRIGGEMATWTTRTTIDASPDDVLAMLTDPDECSRWSPISFNVERLDCQRLSAGCSARVGGELAGRRVSFDIDVLEAEDGRLRLRASGPVDLDVDYLAEALAERSEVCAQISV